MAPSCQAARCLLATAALALALAAAPAAAYTTGSWVLGRGTYFGEDAWSLHDGSCGYGFICPNRWSDELVSGRDVVALATPTDDPMWDNGAACGQCLEVRCRDAEITDDFGNSYARAASPGYQYCKSGYPAVKVKITDQCPCVYPDNAVSNSQWCCGPTPHLDVSQWALEKMALDVEKWGVFALEWRTVDCLATIDNEAPAVPLSEQDADPYANQQGSIDCNAQSTGSAGSSGSSTAAVSDDDGSDAAVTLNSDQRAVAAPAPTPEPTPASPSPYSWQARLAAIRAARASGQPTPTIRYSQNAVMQRLDAVNAAIAAGTAAPPVKGRRLLLRGGWY